MDGVVPHGRRPRPVADAPAVDPAVVAKAWLLALVADAPLAAAGHVPAAELARGGPALCGAVLAALGSTAALERLVVGDGRAPLAASAARLTGARTAGALTAGVEALRAVTWRALRAQLRDGDPELVADLSDRLAYVCARVTEAALPALGAENPARREGPLADALAATAPPGAATQGIRAFAPRPAAPTSHDGDGASHDDFAHPSAPRRDDFAPTRDDFAHPSRDGSAPNRDDFAHPGAPRIANRDGSAPNRDDFAHPGAPRIASPDDFAPHVPSAEDFTGAVPSARSAPSERQDEPIAAPPAGVRIVDLPGAPVIEAGDPLATLAEELAGAPRTTAPEPDMYATARDAPTVTRLRAVDTTWEDARDTGPPWLAAIARRLERREQDGRPFAVFVVEVDDLDRLLAAQSGREVALALETAERGLTAELAPADLVVRERLGRWWLTSPDRDPAAARDLGTRVATAIAHAQLGGAPLSASIGLATCPGDGDTLDTLASRADEGMFTARASGVPLA
jgi:GGDEF domain-containing protein